MTDHSSRDSIFQSVFLPYFGLRFRKSAHALIGSVAFAGTLLATPTVAQTPPVVISQVTKLGAISGSVLDGGQPAGTSVGVTSSGNLILGNTYGNTIYEVSGTTGVVTTLGTFNNAGPIAVDSNNNIYITSQYGSTVTKVPVLSNGIYPVLSSSPPACVGNDTVECTLAALSSTYIYGGYSSIAFDPSGNFYFVTGYNAYSSSSIAQNGAIWKCSVTCFSGANSGTAGNAAVVYTNPQPTDGSLRIVGSLAVDSLGDIYYTDSDYNPAGNAGSLESSYSDLKELPVGASSATTLYTFTIASPGGYDDEIDAVAVDSSNTVYFATQYTGTFAMLSNGGVANPATIYAVSPQGAKVLTTDRHGRFYGDNYFSSTDAAFSLSVGLVSASTTTVGTPSSATGVSAVLNSGVTCSNAPTTTVTSTTTEFSATAGTCATTGLINAPVIPLTVTFTPAVPGTRTATLTATSGGSGTATVTGVATGGTVPTPTFTPAAGTYSTAQTVTIADATVGATIYYTLNGSTPTTSSSVYSAPISVASSETVKAIATYAGSTTSSVASAAYTITLLTSQTITFTQPTSPVQYGVAPITLSATASSNLPVTFTVTSGPATVNGNILTITGAGSVVVMASQAGNGSYAAATPVSRTIVVNGGSAQLIFFPALANYANGSTVPLIAGSTSGLVVTFTATGPATVNGNGTLTVTGTGTITVTAAQSGNGNFAPATSVSQSFTAQ